MNGGSSLLLSFPLQCWLISMAALGAAVTVDAVVVLFSVLNVAPKHGNCVCRSNALKVFDVLLSIFTVQIAYKDRNT